LDFLNVLVFDLEPQPLKITVLFLEHMVLKLEQLLGSKNSIAVLRYLTLRPYASFGLSELAEILEISKSNILRVLKPLQEAHLINEQKAGRKKLLQINGQQEIVPQLWKIFMLEKKSTLAPEFKNIIDLFYSKIREKVDVFILFGSVARGLATRESDIDIVIIGDTKISGPILDYLPFRFEVHNYTWRELQEKKDFVVLEALTNGIVYKGELYALIKELKLFPKAYLIYRLNKVKEFVQKAKESAGQAKKYYQTLANIASGEIESLLNKKGIQPKRFLKTTVTLPKIEELEKRIAQEGAGVWIT